MQAIDALHLVLMMVALGLTYLLPFELLLFSYAALGPAHYLTEISWLHDRKYFLPDRSIAVLLGTATLAFLFVYRHHFGVFIWSAFVACTLLAAATTAIQRAILAAIAASATIAIYVHDPSFAVVGALLPTLVHVSMFTLIFMLVGAYRSGSKMQGLIVATYVCCIGLLLAEPPSAGTVIPRFAELARAYFGEVGPALGRVFGLPNLQLDSRLVGLLSFIYTYHYLNWFLKAKVIRWATVPKARLAVIAALSAISTGIYLYDYALGISALLCLSILHVVLEFPLNSISMRDLGAMLQRGLTLASTGAVRSSIPLNESKRPDLG